MSNTYTQIHVQVIFAVKGRQSLIRSYWKDELYQYITGIVTNKGHKLLAINGVSDHIHILLGVRPHEPLSALIKEVKRCSSSFINQHNWVKGRFSWQSGYGAFSYGRSQLDQVCQYIKGQEQHHKVMSFREEYIAFLEKFEVAYKEEYLFEWVEGV